jgi:dTDP-4-amino-4,6-dideoxy-D-galactose acyltransferase
VSVQSSDAEPCKLLAWDSEFFRLRIGSVVVPDPGARELDRVLAWCAEHRIDCVYLLCDVANLATQRAAQTRGFRIVDVRMTFARELASDARFAAPDPCLRAVRESDLAELRALAAASHTNTRFWNDERFSREACAELYAKWIENSVRGFADHTFVAEVDGRIAGYLTCHRREDAGEIGLVAVAESARGRRLGAKLVDASLGWFAANGLARARVVTQGSGLVAQRLYQSAGFRTHAIELWHHRWSAPTERKTP